MEQKKLVELAKHGNAKAFGKLYDAYAQKMRGVCANIVKSKNANTEDIVHDAFIVAFLSIGKLRDTDRFGEWLTTITRNLSIKYLKQKQETHVFTLSDITETLSDDGCPKDKTRDIEEILKTIEKLPEGYKRVFKLSVLEGLSHNEIAKILDIEPHSSSSQLHRAKMMLRKMLSGNKTFTLILTAIFATPVNKYQNFSKRCITFGKTHEVDILSDTTTPSQFHASRIAPTILNTGNRSREQDTCNIVNDTLSLTMAQTDKITTEHEEKQKMSENERLTAIPTVSSDKNRVSKWKMLLVGSIGPELARNAYRLIKGKDDGDMTSGNQDIDTWEIYYEYLKKRVDFTSPKDSVALLEIAKNNKGKIIEREKHDKPITFGLCIEKRVCRRWGIESGIQYTLLKSAFTTGEGSYYIRKTQKLHYLGVPLRLSYRVTDYHKFSIKTSTGLTMNIPLGGSTKQTLFTDSASITIGKHSTRVPFQWSVGTSLGLQYELASGLCIYVEPTINYYIPTGSNTRSSWTEKPFTFSIPFGIRFEF